MPFLRVIRDKRGYETTYLFHWYREGGRQRSKILYVFRTPGGVRVGRSALEPEVLRQIEAQHPGISFDWNAVRENQQLVEPAVEPRRRKPRREDDGAAQAQPAAAETAKADMEPRSRPASAPPPPRPAVPAVIEGATPDEQLAFLARWYVLVRERIPRRTSDPARLEALNALAERINPATWTDADQITAGLQQASEALERLSHVFAKRRRRPRRRPGDAPQAGREGPSGSEPAADAPPDPADPASLE